jgi:lycopene cyclase domain-containing protein
MTYFGFLNIFLILPIILFSAVVYFQRRKSMRGNPLGGKWPTFYTFLLLVVIALIYTTPWDNYLVATSVWWYDVSRVLGVTLGWVPLEEYLFFILQPILVGLWMLIIASRMAGEPPGDSSGNNIRRALSMATLSLWILSLSLLVYGGISTTYLSLELVWALPAMILQFAFGGDILWRYRKMIFWTIIPLTAYLSLADAIAIQAGVWTISPVKSSGIFLGGTLPLEEFVFFLLTNSLVTFGFVLIWAPESWERLLKGWERLKRGDRIAVLTEDH